MARLTSTPTTVTVLSNNLPAWVPAPGLYASVSLANASTIDPDPGNTAVYWGNAGFNSIWSTYNGGAFAPTLGAYGSLLFFGGGHFSYEGNGVVRYDVETRTFSMLTMPDLVGTRHTIGDPNLVSMDGPTNDRVGTKGHWIKDGSGNPIPGTTVDGVGTTVWKPYPIHTNCGITFIPADAGGGPLGSMVFVGHNQTGIRVVSPGCLWRLDLSTLVWSTVPFPFSPYNSPNGCEYDSLNKVLWCFRADGSSPYVHSYLTDTARVVGPNINNTSGYANGCFLADRKLMLFIIREGADKIEALDVSTYAHGTTSSVPRFRLNLAGIGPTSIWNSYGQNDKLEYCELDGCLYHVQRGSGPTIQLFKLTPPPVGEERTGAWTWSSETLAANPGDPRGTFACNGANREPAWGGKCRYVPAIKCLVLSDGKDVPAQALRSAAWL